MLAQQLFNEAPTHLPCSITFQPARAAESKSFNALLRSHFFLPGRKIFRADIIVSYTPIATTWWCSLVRLALFLSLTQRHLPHIIARVDSIALQYRFRREQMQNSPVKRSDSLWPCPCDIAHIYESAPWILLAYFSKVLNSSLQSKSCLLMQADEQAAFKDLPQQVYTSRCETLASNL